MPIALLKSVNDGFLEGQFISRRFSSKWILSLAVLLATVAQAAEIGRRPSTRLAALALPTGPGADWQQWDSFLTNVVKKLSESFQPALRDQLAEVFLDSRYRLTDTLRSGIADPVPQLFTDRGIDFRLS